MVDYQAVGVLRRKQRLNPLPAARSEARTLEAVETETHRRPRRASCTTPIAASNTPAPPAASASAGVRPSMGRRGNCYDNESFWSTLANSSTAATSKLAPRPAPPSSSGKGCSSNPIAITVAATRDGFP